MNALHTQYCVTQGSSLGNSEEVTRVVHEHNLYTDDTQIYASSKLCDAAVIRHCLGHCANQLKSWCASRRLQLNGDKSDIMWFGSKTNRRGLATEDVTLLI